MVAIEKYATLSEAANVVANGARYFGGGTLIMRALNYAEEGYERLVLADDPALRTIARERDQLVLGSGVTMAQVVRSPEAEFLSSVARAVGGPAIRSAATVGGNLFAEHPYGDFSVALLALDATVSISGGARIELEQFLAGRANFSGIVESVTAKIPERTSFRFKKVSRVKPKGVSVMSIASWLPQSGGRISGARITFGAMGPTPLRAKGVEQTLEGGNLDETTVDRAVAQLTNDLQPFDDPIASAWYRREVAPVHLKRLLLERNY
ncbi:MAG: FAD binding domain-containing protein [Pseudomonadota bacterium]